MLKVKDCITGLEVLFQGLTKDLDHLLQYCAHLSGEFRESVLAVDSVLGKLEALRYEEALAAQADEEVALTMLGLQRGQWVTVECPPSPVLNFAVRRASYDRLDPARFLLAGTHVNKSGSLLNKYVEVRLNLFDKTRPHRMIKHDKVFDCGPFPVELRKTNGFRSHLSEAQLEIWSNSMNADSEDAQAYWYLRNLLRTSVVSWAHDSLIEASYSHCEIGKALNIFLKGYAREINRLDRLANAVETRELKKLCKFKVGQLIRVAGEKVVFVSRKVTQQAYGPVLSLVGQPIFSDGTPAGACKTFELGPYEAKRVRIVP